MTIQSAFQISRENCFSALKEARDYNQIRITHYFSALARYTSPLNIPSLRRR